MSCQFEIKVSERCVKDYIEYVKYARIGLSTNLASILDNE